MAFQRLNVRAKKSFPGLYSFEYLDNLLPTKGTTTRCESPSYSTLPGDDANDCDLNDFGGIVERCKDSPGEGSPSKRSRLLGSLRSFGSLRSLRSSPRKTKQGAECRVETKESCTTPLHTSPSLSLNFEQSPPDQPIFELHMHHRSVSGSSMKVQHSSSIIVPGSARPMLPYNISSPSIDLPAGTIPVTPGPLQKAFDRDPANKVLPWHNASPTPTERNVSSTPVLTPLPGTNLSLENFDHALVALPPSVTSSQTGRQIRGYFDISTDEESQMDDADALNGLACLKLAAHHDDIAHSDTESSIDDGAHAQRASQFSAEEIRREYENTKFQDATCAQDVPRPQARALRRKRQAANLNGRIRALHVPQHHQVLPFRLKQQDEEVQDRIRNDSVVGELWDASDSQSAPASIHEYGTSSRSGDSVNNSAPSNADEPEEAEEANSLVSDFAHLDCDRPIEPRHRAPVESAWGRHTGLYDGTGYGHDATFPTTPCESDEGMKGGCMQSSHHPIKPFLLFGNEKRN